MASRALAGGMAKAGGRLLELVTAVMTMERGARAAVDPRGVVMGGIRQRPACKGALDLITFYSPAFAKYKLPCSGSEIRGLLPRWW